MKINNFGEVINTICYLCDNGYEVRLSDQLIGLYLIDTNGMKMIFPDGYKLAEYAHENNLIKP